MLDNYIKWFESHERLLLFVAGGLVLWFTIGKIDTLIANHDKVGLQQAQAVAALQAQENAKTLALVQQQAADLKALNDKVVAQNTQIEQANIALANALVKQQRTDATLPPNELAARWDKLVPQASATVTAKGIEVPTTGAVATVQELEKVPVLTEQLVGVKTELAGDAQIIASQKSSIDSLNVLVVGKDKSLADADKVCQEQIKVVKDAEKKSKKHWFEGGVVGGVISTIIVFAKLGMIH